MKGIKTLVSVTAIAACLGAASMATASTINPDGPFSTTAGSITVRSPSSFGGAITCGITFTGTVTGGVASITGASLTGGGLCGVPVLTGLPWTLTATSGTTASVTNVGYNIAKTFLYPATQCGPSPLSLNWNATSHVLSLATAGQTLTGHTTGTGDQNCYVDALSVTAGSITVTP
ncbi:protein activator of alkane oxidation PraB [Pseudomonas gingeri NCPPB 3146 = LMG 5327]|uniref:Protein activator of alkane oxidation PraB n=2 Tax=Pseudomonas gingeri TaxID=117681 RepID=A0A7Y7XWN3_9PSED|nr:alkane oxidation protein activator PraB [Pseudomonas gingeri]NVZ24210.1 protein activator of alkane oxidation PraB [Pseudomonas gingeri]NWC13713.1 protein activator of alkane oxidation PraB [Pseudomonas gingeri]NWE45021.1 protein activator of alkane oxidation PraB [Pseudomonas gingeri]NWE68544.1 protein activator of alkane oxidation PraB [Pseudomonas gingeri]PNQ92557.1 protein activator of alkane oxidation PraB [Pseudomonas gingeri NCPPB 3146 = LMG 5327]